MSWVRGSGRISYSKDSHRVRSNDYAAAAKGDCDTTEFRNEAEGKLASSMVKRGSYKLVLTNSGDDSRICPETRRNFTVPLGHDQTEVRASTTRERQKGEQETQSFINLVTLKKIGRHKLVLESEKEQITDNQEPQENSPTSIGKSNGPIAATSNIVENVSIARCNNEGDPERKSAVISHNRTNAMLRGPRKRPQIYDYSKHPVAQRVRLNNPETRVEEARKVTEEYVDPVAAKAVETQTRLSNFAYRGTGRTIHRYQSRSWNAVDGSGQLDQLERSQKMGLVRANQSRAPICPFYAQGIECSDRFCQKRHDVPKEAAVPVCSFFQRNGQCLKEDCKFRHIKVNPRSALCPMFSLVGYCESKDCSMKHVRPHPKAFSKQNSFGNTGIRNYIREG